MADVSNEVRAVVEQALREQSSFSDAVQEIHVEEALDEAGQAFLRISLRLNLPYKNVDDELESLLENIEEAVAVVDDRYASVRFLDAA